MRESLESAFVYFVRIDFNAPKNVFMDWLLAVLSLAFGIYAYEFWNWSWWWPAGGVFAIAFAVARPFGRMQRKFQGMIKRRTY